MERAPSAGKCQRGRGAIRLAALARRRPPQRRRGTKRCVQERYRQHIAQVWSHEFIAHEERDEHFDRKQRDGDNQVDAPQVFFFALFKATASLTSALNAFSFSL